MVSPYLVLVLTFYDFDFNQSVFLYFNIVAIYQVELLFVNLQKIGYFFQI